MTMNKSCKTKGKEWISCKKFKEKACNRNSTKENSLSISLIKRKIK